MAASHNYKTYLTITLWKISDLPVDDCKNIFCVSEKVNKI